MKPVMHVKRDLSSKMCGTREFFVAFRENQRQRKDRLSSAVGFILCATFLSWLIQYNNFHLNTMVIKALPLMGSSYKRTKT